VASSTPTNYVMEHVAGVYVMADAADDMFTE